MTHDELVQEFTNIWQDLLDDDDEAEKKAVELCKQEIMLSITTIYDPGIVDDQCAFIFYMIFVNTVGTEGPECFVDMLEDQIKEIKNNGGKFPDDMPKKIVSKF